jgi:hypothetical protein
MCITLKITEQVNQTLAFLGGGIQISEAKFTPKNKNKKNIQINAKFNFKFKFKF